MRSSYSYFIIIMLAPVKATDDMLRNDLTLHTDTATSVYRGA